jgi:nucleotide-binding universal stress UspA family protein
MTTWEDYYTDRQLLVLGTLAKLVRGLPAEKLSTVDDGLERAVKEILALGVSRLADICNALCMWETSKTTIAVSRTASLMAALWPAKSLPVGAFAARRGIAAEADHQHDRNNPSGRPRRHSPSALLQLRRTTAEPPRSRSESWHIRLRGQPCANSPNEACATSAAIGIVDVDQRRNCRGRSRVRPGTTRFSSGVPTAMLRRLLVAVDGTPASRGAQDLAIALARRQGAALIGVAVVDGAWATAPQATPIGGTAYKEHRDRKVLEDLRQEVEVLLKGFAQGCRDAGVACTTVRSEGAPAQVITAEAEGCDLIVVGRDTSFHFATETDMADTVARLIRNNARPLLVTSAQPRAGDRVLVCYDGSIQASRAMHMAVLLGLVQGIECHLITVAADRAVAELRLGLAETLFQAHGVPVELHASVSDADPADLILATVDALVPQLLVMGAFGHRGLRELFLGSATRTLLRRCDTGILIHH